MKRIFFLTILSGSAFFLVESCQFIKSEDDRIREALIGKFYEDDSIDEDGTQIKDQKGEFYKNGKFWIQGTVELNDEDESASYAITLKLEGEWKVKDKFIFYTYDYNTLEITPDFYMTMKDVVIESMKEKNTPEKVIEYDASKIVYEDSDGKRYTKKKSY